MHCKLKIKKYIWQFDATGLDSWKYLYFQARSRDVIPVGRIYEKKVDSWKKGISRHKKNSDVKSQWFTKDMKIKNKSNLFVNSCMLLKTIKKNFIIQNLYNHFII